MSGPIINAPPPTPAETDAHLLQICRDLLDNRARRKALEAELEELDGAVKCLVTDAERQAALDTLGIQADAIPETRTALVALRADLKMQIWYAENRETGLEGLLIDKYLVAQKHRETMLAERQITPPISLLSGVQIRQVWRQTWIDKDLLPDAFWTPDLPAIKKLGREQAPAGVSWEQQYTVAIKKKDTP
jgi:hypothetical protein